MFEKILCVLITSTILTSGLTGFSQNTFPDTEIYLVNYKADSSSLSFDIPKNITNHEGYDNQPSFLPSGKELLFTSVRDSQADVYKYDMSAGSTIRITSSPESEFSPSPLKNENSFSSVRVEKDSTQRIWTFSMDGSNPQILFPEVDSIGYHCLFGKDTAAVFIVSEPPALYLLIKNKAPKLITSNIGRCIKKIPGKNAFSFVEKIEPWLWILKEYSLETGKFSFIAQTPYESEDYEWLSPSMIVMGQKGKLLKLNHASEKEWKVTADFSNQISNITRIAVNPQGNKVALAGTARKQP